MKGVFTLFREAMITVSKTKSQLCSVCRCVADLYIKLDNVAPDGIPMCSKCLKEINIQTERVLKGKG